MTQAQAAAKCYHVAVVMSRPGITDGQLEAVAAKVKTIALAMGPEWSIAMLVVCFDGKSSTELWPDVVRKLSGLPQVVLTDLTACNGVVEVLSAVLVEDEVWCLPCKGQARLMRARVPRLYFMAQENPLLAPRFKWIPHWVGDDKLKKGNRI